MIYRIHETGDNITSMTRFTQTSHNSLENALKGVPKKEFLFHLQDFIDCRK